MQTFLLSPLSVEECIVRLEESKKKDGIPFSREYHPPYGEFIDNTFNLRVNIGKYMPFMRGEMVGTAEGTLITCSMEVAKAIKRINLLWLTLALPTFLCMVALAILDGFKNGFSTPHFVIFIIGIGLPIFGNFTQRIGKRQMELDKQELLDFLQITLEAKYRTQ